MGRIRTIGISVGLGVLSATGAASKATVLYDSGGFETPRFTAPAALGGQDSGKWIGLVTAQNAPITASVITFSGGTQGVALARSTPASPTAEGGNWFVNAPVTPTVANNLVTITWSMLINTSQTTNNPFFGIDAFDSLGNSVAAIGIDAGTGDLTLQTSGGTNEYNSAFHDGGNAFHSYAAVLNYTTHTFQVFVDGLQRGNNFNFAFAGADFSDADLSTFNAGTATNTSAGLAYFDNYVVTSTPEPTALALAMVVVPGLLRRKRR